MFNFNKKTFTVREWERLEADKVEQINKAREDLEALNANRSEIMRRIGEGEQNARTELEKLKLQIEGLQIDIEASDAVLKSIPARKNYARGVEIEALVPDIEKLDAQFSSFVDDINKKAAALDTSNKSFRKFLEEFERFEATKYLGLRGDFVSFGLGGISRNSFSSSSISYSDPKEIDLTIALMAAVYDKERFNAWVEKTRSSIAKQIALMRDHVLRLKGKDLPNPPFNYCPLCYGNTGWPNKDGKIQCGSCKKTVEPVCIVLPSDSL